MIKKKVCMIGAYAVGKTSLVQRFVKGIFSEKYLTTLGVKIDKKSLEINGETVELMLWDLAGEDEMTKVRSSYLKGASGYLLVVDGTRYETFEMALDIQKRLNAEIGELPFVLIINKSDLKAHWQIPPQAVLKLLQQGWQVLESSALDNDNVEQSFYQLGEKMLAP